MKIYKKMKKTIKVSARIIKNQILFGIEYYTHSNPHESVYISNTVPSYNKHIFDKEQNIPLLST